MHRNSAFSKRTRQILRACRFLALAALPLPLAGCPLDFQDPPSSGATCDSGGTSTGTGGASSSSSTGTGSTTITGCLPSLCPQPAEPECMSVRCENNACAYSFAAEQTACGFAGHCDSTGHCTGLVEPLSCASPCPDLGECIKSYCDQYTGACSSFHLDSGHPCDDAAGHCNEYTGTCCHGLLIVACQDIGDPVACFPVCASSDDPKCSVQCVEKCPPAMLEKNGYCLPPP